MANKPKDLTNQRFGRLIALSIEPERRISPSGSSRVVWKCQCDCGNICYVPAFNLKKGISKSCGCYRSERGRDMFTIHGLGRSRLNKIWHGIKARCTNPKDYHFASYGAKGIKICDEWLNDFITFYEWSISHGYRDDLSIDRINPYGNYEPTNCRWVDTKIQSRNKTTTAFLTYNGVKKSLADWADVVGILATTIDSRIKKHGWSIERALTTPPYKCGRRRKNAG